MLVYLPDVFISMNSRYLYWSARYHVVYAYWTFTGSLMGSFTFPLCISLANLFDVSTITRDDEIVFKEGIPSSYLTSTIPIFFSDGLLLVMTLMAFIATNFVSSSVFKMLYH